MRTCVHLLIFISFIPRSFGVCWCEKLKIVDDFDIASAREAVHSCVDKLDLLNLQTLLDLLDKEHWLQELVIDKNNKKQSNQLECYLHDNEEFLRNFAMAVFALHNGVASWKERSLVQDMVRKGANRLGLIDLLSVCEQS